MKSQYYVSIGEVRTKPLTTNTMPEPQINQHELYKILAIVGDDMPTGVELLNLFIKNVSLDFAQQVIKDMRLEINKK